MKIARPMLAAPPRLARARSSHWTGLPTGLLVVVLAALACGLGAVGQSLGWYAPVAGVWAALQNPRRAVWLDSALPTLYLDVEFNDAQRLEAQLERAARDGVYIPEARDVVTAAVRLGGAAVPVRLSLRPGLYDKGAAAWSFDAQALDKNVLGWRQVRMSRLTFSQWGLGESLRREGILSAPAQWAQLVFNGDALGVYSVWPAPGAEWLAQQGRWPGALVYFDPSLHWRDAQRQGPLSLSVDLSDCQAAAVAVLYAPETDPSGERAAALLRVWQAGRPPSEVLDAEKMGALLALAALWQGSPRPDWPHLAFYLNPATEILEPAAEADWISVPADAGWPWPACLDDPLVQRAYLRALDRISRPEYLQELKAELGDKFEQARSMLGADNGKAALNWDDLAARQAQLARWLEPTQVVLASWTLPEIVGPDTVVHVQLANLQRAPVEVLGLDVGKSTFLPFDPAWIQDGAEAAWPGADGALVLRAAGQGRLRAVSLALPYVEVFSAGRALDEPLELRVVTRWWGLTRRHSTVATGGR